MIDMTGVPLLRLIILFSSVFIIGSLACLPLYKFDLAAFRKSKLWLKVRWWVPIFVVFLVYSALIPAMRFALLPVIFYFSGVELLGTKPRRTIFRLYYVGFCLSLTLFYFLGILSTSLSITIAISVVLSDVAAFFFGNYLGRHPLPKVINVNKNWEGVAGQLLGALLGTYLITTFVTPMSHLWLFVPIGLGSAAGDLVNSYMKRIAGKKDWSQRIPGHGGFTDRFSSLAGASLITFWSVLLLSIVSSK